MKYKISLPKHINVTMLPALIYGCETWSLSKQQETKIQATQMRVVRRIEGVSGTDEEESFEEMHTAFDTQVS